MPVPKPPKPPTVHVPSAPKPHVPHAPKPRRVSPGEFVRANYDRHPRAMYKLR